MSHIMRPQSFEKILRWVISEYRNSGSIFGIHKSLFYTPKKGARYATPELFGDYLATPVGPAAGPNTQLTQNIICSWLSGARFIELKTVQIMDELEFGRPCIDMEDEGYNAEWSQELKLDQSIQEYIKAWVLIPVLHRMLGWEEIDSTGMIFNLSVGYNLDGILQPRMQKFIDTMMDATKEIAYYRDILKKDFPEFADIAPRNSIVNSCTLSTMHGCPPDEIEKIATYLLEERKFHLTVKLNPTLLGRKRVLGILHDDLGYHGIQIEPAVFDHDLQYPKALELIKSLQGKAQKQDRFFGVKLSNTLAMTNYRGIMPGAEMYMSGRSLYPVTMNLWRDLSHDLKGKLNVSYSAGADEQNLATILSCGALPVTIASDILKPGGYSRFTQCLTALDKAMEEQGVEDLTQLAKNRVKNLDKAAEEALVAIKYKKSYCEGIPKVEASLPLFDCVVAPCMEQCAVNQDIPAYAWQIAQGNDDAALKTILHKNPLPAVTGYVCTHLCQSACTRIHYDRPVEIRALKRFAVEHGKAELCKAESTGRKVAIVGSGPSGLAAAMNLALAGVEVTIFEARPRAGGMMSIAPIFRLPHEVMDEDVKRITDLGVKLILNHRVEDPKKLIGEFDAVYVACGFPKDASLNIPGMDAPGVFTSLDLLTRVSAGEKLNLGKKALIIGGGNTAMDAARTASRVTGSPVTVVYRRTRGEMPAIPEEQKLLFEEGNELIELAAPQRVVIENGVVVGLECERTKLGEPDASGRRSPVPTGEKFIVKGDSVVLAIGQEADRALFKDSSVTLKKNGAIEVGCNKRTSVCGLYAGGDAITGPAIVIQACDDGRKAAEAICKELCIEPSCQKDVPAGLTGEDIVQIKKARTMKIEPYKEEHLPVAKRTGFDLVEKTLDVESARREAARCLQCTAVCDKCVEVCPNRANYAYTVTPIEVEAPVLISDGGGVHICGAEGVSIKQSRQIVHIDDFCNECGNCATFCVHQGRPYHDKPRLVMDEGDFYAEEHPSMHLKDNVLLMRKEGNLSKLDVKENSYQYDNDYVEAVFDKGFALLSVRQKKSFEGKLSLKEAVEMAVFYGAVRSSMPWL